MMRSLFSGVSGLKSHQTKMDIIGNNIANVNTTAYKTMSINFSDLMYQTTQAATAPNPTTGRAGTNPKQIGLGVQTAAITTKITEEGATQSTGNPFDLKIAGDEFFVVSDGANTFFTRDGSFYVDADGNLAMSSTGYTVMGWQAVEDAETGTLNIKKDTVSALQVMNKENMTYGAEWTQAATVSGIVDWNDSNQSLSSGNTVTLQFYDNIGYSYTAKFSMHNGYKPTTTDENYSFYVELEDILDSTGKSIWNKATDANKVSFGSAQSGFQLSGENYGVQNYQVTTTSGVSYIKYVPQGAPAGTTPTTIVLYVAEDADQTFLGSLNGTDMFSGTGDNKTVNTANLGTIAGSYTGLTGVTVTAESIFKDIYGSNILATDITSATVSKDGTMKVTSKDLAAAAVLTYSGNDGTINEAAAKYTMDLSGLGDAFTQIEIDFSKTHVTDNKGKSTVTMEKGNAANGNKGRAEGALQGISIQTNGIIYASYSNGQQKILGQIAVAQFANAAGLQKEGDNLYSATNNSGDFDGIGIDISVNGDSMNTGVLEMSNVDLSSEFTEMITTQRGFQANSRIITVSDTLLEELVNLKR